MGGTASIVSVKGIQLHPSICNAMDTAPVLFDPSYEYTG